MEKLHNNTLFSKKTNKTYIGVAYEIDSIVKLNNERFLENFS
jgi:hypothetical protein